jgi:hypothetical protein
VEKINQENRWPLATKHLNCVHCALYKTIISKHLQGFQPNN